MAKASKVAQRPAWTMPSWMESYREHVVGNGGPIETLMNGHTRVDINAPLALIEMGVETQVALLMRLHNAGLLVCRG